MEPGLIIKHGNGRRDFKQNWDLVPPSGNCGSKTGQVLDTRGLKLRVGSGASARVR